MRKFQSSDKKEACSLTLSDRWTPLNTSCCKIYILHNLNFLVAPQFKFIFWCWCLLIELSASPLNVFFRLCRIIMETAVAPFQKFSLDSLSGASTHSCSENNLKFICKFWAGPLQAGGDENCCDNENSESVSVILPAQCSIYQLRLRISMKVCKPKLEGFMQPPHPHNKRLF